MAANSPPEQVSNKAAPSHGRPWAAPGLLLPTGLVLGAALLLGFVRGATLRSYPQVVTDPDPLLLVYGSDTAGLIRFLVAVAVSFTIYFMALWASARAPGRYPFLTIFVLTLLFSLTLVPMYPVGSQDLIHNIADARTFWRYHDNPLFVPPLAHPDPISTQVVAFAEEPSYYGPGWYLLLGLPHVASSDDLVRSIVAHKVFTVVFFLGSVVVLYHLLRAVRPAWAVPSLVVFAWNPLVLFETAGNGHNDIAMVFFALVALWAALRRRWVLAPIALALAVLVKYTLVVLGPVLLVYALRSEGRRVVRPLVFGSLAGILLAVAVVAPFWEGLQTFQGLRGGLSRWHASPASLVYHWLLVEHSPIAAARLVKGLMGLVFLAGYGWLVGRLQGTASSLLRTSTAVVLWFLLVMAWWFLPWYVLWLLPFTALVTGWPLMFTGITLSCTAFLGYVAIAWGRVLWSIDPGFGLELSRALLIWTAPLLLWVMEPLRSALLRVGANDRCRAQRNTAER